MAESALGGDPSMLLARIDRATKPSGAIGANVNSTIWGILALRQAAHRPAPRAWSVRPPPSEPLGRLVVVPRRRSRLEQHRRCRPPGAALGRRPRRADPPRLAYLHRLQNPEGGFELTPGRGSDAQSTAWAIQAFVAARKPTPRGALDYLRSMHRADGSFRYSHRYATTPVWVTSQVLAALAGRPFPF